MKMKEVETGIWANTVSQMSNEELGNLSHLYHIRLKILRDEIDKRLEEIIIPPISLEDSENNPQKAEEGKNILKKLPYDVKSRLITNMER